MDFVLRGRFLVRVDFVGLALVWYGLEFGFKEKKGFGGSDPFVLILVCLDVVMLNGD